MTWNFERRIRDIDRRVSPLGFRGLRLQLRKMKVRGRRGIPSDSLPWETWEAVRMGRTSFSVAIVRAALRRKRLHLRPKLSLKETRIFRWKRRQQWEASAREVAGTLDFEDAWDQHGDEATPPHESLLAQGVGTPEG